MCTRHTERRETCATTLAVHFYCGHILAGINQFTRLPRCRSFTSQSWLAFLATCKTKATTLLTTLAGATGRTWIRSHTKHVSVDDKTFQSALTLLAAIKTDPTTLSVGWGETACTWINNNRLARFPPDVSLTFQPISALLTAVKIRSTTLTISLREAMTARINRHLTCFKQRVIRFDGCLPSSALCAVKVARSTMRSGDVWHGHRVCIVKMQTGKVAPRSCCTGLPTFTDSNAFLLILKSFAMKACSHCIIRTTDSFVFTNFPSWQ